MSRFTFAHRQSRVLMHRGDRAHGTSEPPPEAPLLFRQPILHVCVFRFSIPTANGSNPLACHVRRAAISARDLARGHQKKR